jgi:N-sulfoglucosamine sulfohydrolase
MSNVKPNIVFAFADDWGRYASAYQGRPGANSIHELIETPNFDWVAEEGALFLNANVPVPSCTPCRSSVLTGKYFWKTGLGAILEGSRWDESIPTYPLVLEDNGYHIGFTYKVWSPGITQDAPYGGDRNRYEPAGASFGRFSFVVTENSEKLGVEAAKNELLQEVRENFDAFIDDRPDDSPFCYWWGPTKTHRSWQQGSGKEIWGLNPDLLKGRMPEFLPDVEEIREDFNDYLGECQAFDAGLGVIIERLKAAGELDNTIIVVSGDHGIPGIPRAKSNLYNLGTEVALAVRWPGQVSAGREISDFVNMMEVAPTFLDVAEVEHPEGMTAKSLMPLLLSKENGQIEADRDSVVTGIERHCPNARDHQLPYPSRSLRTKDYLYIINFESDRWPIGAPVGLDGYEFPDTEGHRAAQEGNERKTALYRPQKPQIKYFQDIDDGPTKEWMVSNRNEPEIKPLFELSFGKRHSEELYDLLVDPDYMNNVATEPDYQEVKKNLNEKLMSVLTEHEDPRVVESPPRFENPPYAGPVSKEYYEDPGYLPRVNQDGSNK